MISAFFHIFNYLSLIPKEKDPFFALDEEAASRYFLSHENQLKSTF
jgi:hypothetical protein